MRILLGCRIVESVTWRLLVLTSQQYRRSRAPWGTDFCQQGTSVERRAKSSLRMGLLHWAGALLQEAFQFDTVCLSGDVGVGVWSSEKGFRHGTWG